MSNPGRHIVWGGVLFGLLLAALVATVPVAASAAPLFLGFAPPLLVALGPAPLLIVAPAFAREPREPPALRARGALPRVLVRLRRRAGGRP